MTALRRIRTMFVVAHHSFPVRTYKKIRVTLFSYVYQKRYVTRYGPHAKRDRNRPESRLLIRIVSERHNHYNIARAKTQVFL